MTYTTNLNENVLNENILNESILNESTLIMEQMKTPEFFSKINDLYQLIEKTFKNHGKLILIGNGGSSSDSQHIAGEFTGIGLPAISLASNIASITAIANDKTYDDIFADQLIALKPSSKDILIALSTSGNSMNILNAVLTANNLYMTTVGITGNQSNNKLSQHINLTLQIPSSNTQRIQEMTMLIFHSIYISLSNNTNQ